MSRVPPDSVYLLYPRGSRTGGPEAIHQLASTLIELGVPAYVTPLPGTETIPRSSDYDRYNVPERRTVEDREGVWVVASETRLSTLRAFANASPVAWWLSVDNSPYFLNAGKRADETSQDRWNRRKYIAMYQVRRALRSGIDLRRLEHIAQSQYARSFIYANLGVLPALVSDFTTITGIDEDEIAQRQGRPRLSIAFNPAKGGSVLNAIRDQTASLYDWRPIENMTRDQVTQTLAETDIYLDLGHHPGRDRLPREAAIMGCTVLVGMRGSAAFWADVPLARQFKVDMNRNPVTECLDALRMVGEDVRSAVLAQSFYREWIRREKSTFSSEVESYFVKGQMSSDTSMCIHG